MEKFDLKKIINEVRKGGSGDIYLILKPFEEEINRLREDILNLQLSQKKDIITK